MEIPAAAHPLTLDANQTNKYLRIGGGGGGGGLDDIEKEKMLFVFPLAALPAAAACLPTGTAASSSLLSFFPHRIRPLRLRSVSPPS